MKLLVFSLLVGVAIAAKEHDEVVNEEFLNGYHKFVSNVYTELKKTNPESFVVSPLSVDLVLSLAEYGSKGKTSQELVTGLHLPENKEKLREAITSLVPKLNVDNKSYTLSIANKVYVKEGYQLKDTFKKFSVDVYGADVESINFEKKETAAENMNKWVADKTFQKIKNLVDKDDLDEDTRVLLLNALYFKGEWLTSFDPFHTNNETFYLTSDSKTEVELMGVNSTFRYREDHKLDTKFLEMPYLGHDVTFTIALPNNKAGLKDLETELDKVLEEGNFKSTPVNVKIPKFKIDTKIEFKPILEKLGIFDAFTDNAEITEITDQKLKISKVIQKSEIEVNEFGTTAAAASAAVLPNIRASLRPQEPKEFIADHPFIYFLKYKSVVLFVGHYTGK